MEEFFLMDEKVIQYINEILKNIIKSQYHLRKEFKGILHPESCEFIVLLLKKDNQVDFNLSENVEYLVTYAHKYLRVVERKSYLSIMSEEKAKKSLDRALASYRSLVCKLLSTAGYTNEEELIKSFSARLTQMIQKKEAIEKKTEDDFLDLDI